MSKSYISIGPNKLNVKKKMQQKPMQEEGNSHAVVLATTNERVGNENQPKNNIFNCVLIDQQDFVSKRTA